MGFFLALLVFRLQYPSFSFTIPRAFSLTGELLPYDAAPADLIYYILAAPLLTLLFPASLVLFLRTRFHANPAITLSILVPVFAAAFIFMVPAVHSTYLVNQPHCYRRYTVDIWNSLGYTWFHKGFHSPWGETLCF